MKNLEKQQQTFKQFMNLLQHKNKIKHDKLKRQMNINRQSSEILKLQSVFNKKSRLNIHITSSNKYPLIKQKLVNDINTSQQPPITNFRKQAKFQSLDSSKDKSSISDLNQSLIRVSNNQINQIKSINKIQGRLSHRQYDKSNNIKQYSDFRIKKFNQKNLSFSKVTNIAWNPISQQLESFGQNLQIQFKQNKQSTGKFLLQLLKVNTENISLFLKENITEIQNLNQLESKNICKLFQSLFKIIKIDKLQEPLIKKYKNCVYYGQRLDYQNNHSGIIVYTNGNLYMGQLKKFRKNGLGIDVIQEKSIMNSDQVLQNSNELIQTPNHTLIIYRGTFLENSKTGIFLIHAADYIYQGSLLKGLYHGEGTLITLKSTFQGQWKNNYKVKGIQTFKIQNKKYQGEYLNQKFHGKGKIITKNQLYEGQFHNGLKNGQGIEITQQSIYEGTFLNDVKQDFGLLYDKRRKNTKDQQLEEENIFNVKYKNGQLINRSEYKRKVMLQQTIESLHGDTQSKQTLNIDFQNNKPSKMLQNQQRQKRPQKISKKYQKSPINPQSPKISSQRKQYFNVFPSQPQQQSLFHRFNNRKTFLQGNNRRYFSSSKNVNH